MANIIAIVVPSTLIAFQASSWSGFSRNMLEEGNRPQTYTPRTDWVQKGFVSPSPLALRKVAGALSYSFEKDPGSISSYLDRQSGRDFTKLAREDLLGIGIALRYAGFTQKTKPFAIRYLDACDSIKEKLSYQEYRFRSYVQGEFFYSYPGLQAMKRVYAQDPDDYTTRHMLVEMSGGYANEQVASPHFLTSLHS